MGLGLWMLHSHAGGKISTSFSCTNYGEKQVWIPTISYNRKTKALDAMHDTTSNVMVHYVMSTTTFLNLSKSGHHNIKQY